MVGWIDGVVFVFVVCKGVETRIMRRNGWIVEGGIFVLLYLFCFFCVGMSYEWYVVCVFDTDRGEFCQTEGERTWFSYVYFNVLLKEIGSHVWGEDGLMVIVCY